MTADEIIKLIEEHRLAYQRWADECEPKMCQTKVAYLERRDAMRTLLSDIKRITAANAAKETK